MSYGAEEWGLHKGYRKCCKIFKAPVTTQSIVKWVDFHIHQKEKEENFEILYKMKKQ